MQTNCPVILTDDAATYFSKLLMGHAKMAIRLAITDAGCSGKKYNLSMTNSRRCSDYQWTIDPEITLCIPHDDVEYLNGTIIDVEHGSLDQKTVVYRNPNAQNNCGCGLSFAYKKTEDLDP